MKGMQGFLKKTLDPLGLMSKDQDMGVAFVTSGSNVVGYRVTMALLEAGHKNVRVGVWKGARQPGVSEEVGQLVSLELENKGATIIKFDWTDEEGYTMALAGVKSVFCTLPHMEENDETNAAFINFVKACRTNGVEHFVKTSFYSVEERGVSYEGILPYAKFHHKCDRELDHAATRMDSHMSYTLLRTSHLMSTPLVYQNPILREDAKYMTASYGMGVNYVSPNDVAKASIVVLLDRKKHKNKAYNLTAEKPITDASVAKLLSEFLDTPIEFVPMSYHDYQAALKNREFPEWLVKDLAITEKIKATGVEEKKMAYMSDLETIIGTKRETFKDYLAQKEAMTHQEYPDKPADETPAAATEETAPAEATEETPPAEATEETPPAAEPTEESAEPAVEVSVDEAKLPEV